MGEMSENRVEAGVCPSMKGAYAVDAKHRTLASKPF
jgi:hypothetical protein